MSFDLYPEESAARQDALNPVSTAPLDTFDNFFMGSAQIANRTMAAGWSGLDLLGSVGPIVQDKITGGTAAQDEYFKEHDLLKRKVDYYLPKPQDVGVAGEVVGQLLGTLPQVILSPSLAVASTQMSVAEDLTTKGVSAPKALAVGTVQASGLGLGIWMPILGKTLAQRVLAGGVGFNVAQGVAMRGASGEILKGTPAEGSYAAFDGTSITLDVLLGAAFGGLAHINPAMRAQGEEMQGRFSAWAKNLKPSEIDALATLKQAEHLNVESMPGQPVDLIDTEAHVNRIRQAIDDLTNDKPVNVENMPEPRFEPDAVKTEAVATTAKDMQAEVAQIAKDEGIDLTPAKAPKPAVDSVAQGQVASAHPTAEGKAQPVDSLHSEAARFAAENPDLPIVTGKNLDGSDITTTPRQMLADADAMLKATEADANLFAVAAGCIMGAI